MNELLTALNVVLTGVYAFLTYKILQMMREQITSSLRPFVYFDLTTHGSLVEGVLKNSGKTAASNVSVSIVPEIKVQTREVSPKPVLLNVPVSFLPPEKEIREFMGSFAELEAASPNLRFAGKITYFDAAGAKFQETFEIELNSRKSMPYISKTTVSAELQQMNTKLADLVRVLDKETRR